MLEGYPNLKEEVGVSIPAYEISSLHDEKLAKWSTKVYTPMTDNEPITDK